jgi:hypothetical protein
MDIPFLIPIHLLELDIRAGRFIEAYSRAQEFLRLNEQIQDPQIAALYVLGAAEAHLGLIGDAQRHAEAGLAASEAINDKIFSLQNRYVLSFIALSTGGAATAMCHVDHIPDLATQLGVADLGLSPFHPDAVEAAPAGRPHRSGSQIRRRARPSGRESGSSLGSGRRGPLRRHC